MEKMKNEQKEAFQPETKRIVSHTISSFDTLCRLCDIDEGYNPIREYVKALNEAAWFMTPRTEEQLRVKYKINELKYDLDLLDKELTVILNKRKQERQKWEQQNQDQE
ncbi:MAG: hypothetical protein IJK22_04175 [Bacteroidales bacterium]|nr:hypothetical protein [Bacteroidales bacterium]